MCSGFVPPASDHRNEVYPVSRGRTHDQHTPEPAAATATTGKNAEAARRQQAVGTNDGTTTPHATPATLCPVDTNPRTTARHDVVETGKAGRWHGLQALLLVPPRCGGFVPRTYGNRRSALERTCADGLTTRRQTVSGGSVLRLSEGKRTRRENRGWRSRAMVDPSRGGRTGRGRVRR